MVNNYAGGAMDLIYQPDFLLDSRKQEDLQRFAEGLNREQLLWASGFLTGIGKTATTQIRTGSAEVCVTVLFGTETGNAKSLASALATRLSAVGVQAIVQDMLTYGRAKLRRDHVVLVIVSTHGDGEPPDSARVLHSALTNGQIPDLQGKRFAVLALGDASYPRFCQAGKDFDTALAAAGAIRLVPRTDCDVDYEEIATHWMEQIIGALATNDAAHTAMFPAPTPLAKSDHISFPASLVERVKLSGRGSSREVWHLELDTDGLDLHYTPGDSISLVPGNPPQFVEELLDRLELDHRASVQTRHGEMPLVEALASRYEITRITRPFLECYAHLSEAKVLHSTLSEESANDFGEWTYGREIIDIIGQYPIKGLCAQSFVDCLRPLPARRYSIASSIMSSPGEVHLTVAAVHYSSHGRERMGVASTFLAERLAVGRSIPMRVEANTEFRLPENLGQPLIMIAAGTGVAPFRAFLQEREALGATGRNWLIFGDRHLSTDFLYQREWLRWLKDGRLTRLDVAFSRDQEHKVYVQDRLRERAADIYAWLEEGAAFYVCGAEAMGRAIQQALIDALRSAGRTQEQAEKYILTLKQEGRYQRDVY